MKGRSLPHDDWHHSDSKCESAGDDVCGKYRFEKNCHTGRIPMKLGIPTVVV
jgi:hypothetical protein